jgi:hypothetical protein
MLSCTYLDILQHRVHIRCISGGTSYFVQIPARRWKSNRGNRGATPRHSGLRLCLPLLRQGISSRRGHSGRWDLPLVSLVDFPVVGPTLAARAARLCLGHYGERSKYRREPQERRTGGPLSSSLGTSALAPLMRHGCYLLTYRRVRA